MAELVSRRSHLMPGRLEVSEMFFRVPKDYSSPSSGTISIFARSVNNYAPPNNPAEASNEKKYQPWYVWLQGGPGKGCLPPQKSPMTKFVLERGYQMLYIDQRGTGLSNHISAETLKLQGSTQQQANYLKLFRADNIVRDCEAIRQILTQNYPSHLRKWTIHGQSFGGYCAMTYLSTHPEGLLEAFITASIPPINKSPEELYRATYPRMIERNRIYYLKYPEDIDTIRRLAVYLESQGGVPMPTGGQCSGSLCLEWPLVAAEVLILCTTSFFA